MDSDHEDSDVSTNNKEDSVDSDYEDSSSQYQSVDEGENEDDEMLPGNLSFKRRFKNVDMSSCWLNSCLQFLLTALDHTHSPQLFTSELGIELHQLQHKETSFGLDPTMVKNTLVSTENTRIAIRLSELEAEVNDPYELQHRVEVVEGLRLDLQSGQQCVKDFFFCLEENILSWPDVGSVLNFEVNYSTKCCACNNVTTSKTAQLYIKIPVPPDNSDLNEYVEEFFNIKQLVGMHCEACKSFVQKEKWSELTEADEAEFVTVILQRTVENMDGYELVKDIANSTNDVFIR